MTTWSCGHHDSVGAVCGDQCTNNTGAPSGRCVHGHHPSHWSPLPLWECVADGGTCEDRRLSDGVPNAPCRYRHEGCWREVRPTPPETVPTPDVDERRPHPDEELIIRLDDRLEVLPQTEEDVRRGDRRYRRVSDGRVVTLHVDPPAPTDPRRRMSGERAGFTRRFRLRYLHKDGRPDVMKLYFVANMYDDGKVGEVFVKADRVGTLASGALDSAAVMISLLLQHGVPLSTVISKLRHTRFEPSGFTGDSEFPSCTSPLDLLAQWLERKFGGAP